MSFGIYIHIPFCVKKCNYCDFLSFCNKTEYIEAYIKALKQEIHIFRQINGNDRVSTIYFGGGTPSSISPIYIEEIMKTIREGYQIEENAEITIECNPGTVDFEKFSSYYHMGINRISLGLQSANAEELRAIGRIHTFEEFLFAYQMARKAGFQNISVDVMSALPKQTMETYQKTLKEVVRLQPEHISSYSLMIEEGTPFYDMMEKGQLLLPSEDVEREMYYFTNDFLKKYGYHRYEISNYAKNGKESKHNSSYWLRTDYLGFGLGAASCFRQMRFHNTENMDEYLQRKQKYCRLFELNNESDICTEENQQEKEVTLEVTLEEVLKDYEEVQKLSKREQMEEFMFLGLRMINGISISEFEKNFGESFEGIYGDVCRKLEKENLIVITDDRVMLTEKGIDVSNYVLSEFL